MEILALVGSPRKGGNTDTLVDILLDAALKNGHFAKKIYLYDQSVGPCIDCRACKRGTMTCPLPDDMSAIYKAIDVADLLVLGTPVYWRGPTGPMKLLIDRLRPYFANRRLVGKAGLLVATAKDGPDEAGLLTEMIRESFGFLEMRWMGAVVGTAYDLGEIQQDARAIEAAVALGTRI